MNEANPSLSALLGRIRLRGWRLLLETPGTRASTPMLRGVWGRALRHLDFEAYNSVFAGLGPQHYSTPKYILRPAPPDSRIAPAVELILFGVVPAYEEIVWEAWLVACGMGLGPERRPFRIRKRELITRDEPGICGSTLLHLARPTDARPFSGACRISFETPSPNLAQKDTRGEAIAQGHSGRRYTSCFATGRIGKRVRLS